MEKNTKRKIITRPRILHRAHVKKDLEKMLSTPLFFVIASMGFGKTTAVRDFLNKRRKVENIWFTFDDEDAEDIWTWVKFCRTLELTDAQLGKQMFEYGIPHTDQDFDHLISCIKSVIESQTVVVLDDMHLCRSRQMFNIVERVASAGIDQLHFVIIGRTYPLMDVEELVQNGKAYVMTEDRFVFSKTESEDFFTLNDAQLNEAQIEELYEKTKGWTSALYLALLHFRAYGEFKNMETGPKLMRSAVYEQYSEEEQRLLLILSKLNDFSVEQAQFVTMERGVKDIIVSMYESNCFVKFDVKSGRYSFHEMLRRLLSEEFAASDIDDREIYERQGDWLLATGNRVGAIEAFSKCGDHEKILDIMSGRHAAALMNTAPFVIARAFKKIDLATKLSNPIGYLTYIYSYSIIIDIKRGSKMLQEAASYYKRMKEMSDREQVLGEIALIESISAFNNLPKMFECYKRANEYFNGGSSKIFNSDTIITFGIPLTLFLYHQKPGEMLRLVERIEEDFEIFNHIANGCGAGYEYLARAEREYFVGNFEEAEIYVYKALYKARAREQHGIVFSASFLMIRIALSKGNLKEVDEILLQLMQEAETLGNPIMLSCYEFIVGYVYSYIGRYDQIPRWLREGKVSEAKLMAPARDVGYIIVAKVLCERGDYAQLEAMCQYTYQLYTEKNHLIGVILSLNFQCICKYHTSGLEEAKPLLEESLRLAEPDDCVTIFAEHAYELIPILEAIGTPFAKRIIPLSRQFVESRKICRNNGSRRILLTKRECEVMDLVTEGHTAEAISKILFVSHSTVKKHIASAYEKFGVNKKADAIAKYKKMLSK